MYLIYLLFIDGNNIKDSVFFNITEGGKAQDL